jgi:hypothetical protein
MITETDIDPSYITFWRFATHSMEDFESANQAFLPWLEAADRCTVAQWRSRS